MMKATISIIIGLIVFYLIFFQIDPMIVNWVISNVPESANEWLGIIKIGAWIITIFITGGFGIWLSVLIGGGIYLLLDK